MRVNLHYDPDTQELWFALPLRTSDAVEAIIRNAIKPDREYESVGGFTVMVKSVAPKRNNDNQRKP